MAGRQGFEPWGAFTPAVFETVPLNQTPASPQDGQLDREDDGRGDAIRTRICTVPNRALLTIKLLPWLGALGSGSILAFIASAILPNHSVFDHPRQHKRLPQRAFKPRAGRRERCHLHAVASRVAFRRHYRDASSVRAD